MTLADFAPIFTALIAGVGMVITAMIGILVPKAIAAFERRTGVELTTQQRAAVRQAALTQAGIIETQLQQGILRLSDVSPSTPAMGAAAVTALARVPESAAAVGTTPEAMAAIIVGATDTAKAVPPVAIVEVPADSPTPLTKGSRP